MHSRTALIIPLYNCIHLLLVNRTNKISKKSHQILAINLHYLAIEYLITKTMTFELFKWYCFLCKILSPKYILVYIVRTKLLF